MAKMLARTEGSARQRMKLLGIVVPPEIVQKFKEESRIKKGNVPMNKGRKLSEWCPSESIEGMKKTMFRKGHQPHNTKEDGAITIRPDNRGVNYKWIRISLNNWKMLHVKVWEDANGPAPKGKVIAFRNKDTMDCRLENLMLLTRKENMLRNSVHNYGPEIAKAVQLRGALNRQINKHLKKLNDAQKQNH